jgi:hypothetical protein
MDQDAFPIHLSDTRDREQGGACSYLRCQRYEGEKVMIYKSIDIAQNIDLLRHGCGKREIFRPEIAHPIRDSPVEIFDIARGI